MVNRKKCGLDNRNLHQQIGHEMHEVLTSQYPLKRVYYRIKQVVQWHHAPPFLLAWDLKEYDRAPAFFIQPFSSQLVQT